MELLKYVEKQHLKDRKVDFQQGDTIKVFVKITEGEKERIQPFQGVVIRKKGGGISETFTVRKSSYGIGIERTFFFHSPNLVKVDVVRRGHVRRSKLYYLRKLSGKAARVRERKYKPTKK